MLIYLGFGIAVGIVWDFWLLDNYPMISAKTLLVNFVICIFFWPLIFILTIFGK